MEDHNDLMHIFAEQITPLVESHGPYFLSELIEAQDEENHAAVCEVSQLLFTIERLKINVDNKAQNIFGHIKNTNMTSLNTLPCIIFEKLYPILVSC